MVNLLTEFRFSNQNMLRSERQSSVQPEFDRNRYPVLFRATEIFPFRGSSVYVGFRRMPHMGVEILNLDQRAASFCRSVEEGNFLWRESR